MAAALAAAVTAAILGTGFAVTQYHSVTERLFGVAAVPASSLPLLSPIGMFTRLSKSGQPVWPGRPGRVTEDISYPAGWPGPQGSWQVSGWFTGPDGQRLSARAAQAMLNRIPVPVATTPDRLRTWLASRDITYWIGYQPASRYWLFQAAAAVILVTLAAAAGLLAVRAASRRT
jgi:hypothetical protein